MNVLWRVIGKYQGTIESRSGGTKQQTKCNYIKIWKLGKTTAAFTRIVNFCQSFPGIPPALATL
jgi:hypothetical protein